MAHLMRRVQMRFSYTHAQCLAAEPGTQEVYLRYTDHLGGWGGRKGEERLVGGARSPPSLGWS